MSRFALLKRLARKGSMSFQKFIQHIENDRSDRGACLSVQRETKRKSNESEGDKSQKEVCSQYK
jgi:hypothetical protein